MIKLYATMLLLLLTQVTCIAQELDTKVEHQLVPNNTNIDFAGFANLSHELIAERARRRVPLERFLEMAGTPGTIVLPSRRGSWIFLPSRLLA